MAAMDPPRILKSFTFARNTWKTLLNMRDWIVKHGYIQKLFLQITDD